MSSPIKVLRQNIKDALQADLNVAWDHFIDLCSLVFAVNESEENHRKVFVSVAEMLLNVYGVDVTTHPDWKRFEAAWVEEGIVVEYHILPNGVVQMLHDNGVVKERKSPVTSEFFEYCIKRFAEEQIEYPIDAQGLLKLSKADFSELYLEWIDL